ncbi:Serine/threonine-protein kinase PknH [Phycisphaerae bacterium RAS1]|nr:Serine/threonine-protein kinase PknH [Phycisphaerae bacterium RAS1]
MSAEHFVAAGGTCEVFCAIDAATARKVALKKLLPRWNAHPTMIARLTNEAALIGPIDHPNVCRIFEYAVLEGRHTLIMEFIDGESLAARLGRSGPPGVEAAVSLGGQICAGVEALHSAGVLHRDLKPENVLIAAGDVPKLIDFGSAERIGAAATAGATIGTPAYMAPEQRATGETSIGSDVYSLGMVLFELLTGRRFDSAPSRSEIAEDRRRLVDAIAEAALAHRPEQRAASAGAIAAVLRRFTNN